jgi:endonuclease I
MIGHYTIKKHLLQNIFTIVFTLLVSFSVFAQIPTGYYSTANGSGATLKTQLFNIIKTHTAITYDNLWTAYQTTDKKPDGTVWDMYSNCSFTFGSNQCGTYTNECGCYNREHSFPKSWFGGEVSPMYTDLFHIVPTDGKVNGMRNNYPYGEVTSPTYTSANGSKLGPCSFPGYSGIVFEPVDEYKGDFARNYFYMATCYENLIAFWKSNTGADAILDGTSFPCFDSWFLNLLVKWSTNDPVSQKEIDRNNAVYAIQGNRNPYIDHPEYITAVWVGGNPVTPEPSNYPTGFSAQNIKLKWVDATGTIVPQHYLIRMSTIGFDAIQIPVDGTTYPDSATDLNVDYGVQQAWFKNLTAGKIYFFKIYGYTGSGATTDYKTDSNVQQIYKAL